MFLRLYYLYLLKFKINEIVEDLILHKLKEYKYKANKYRFILQFNEEITLFTNTFDKVYDIYNK